MNSLSNGVLLKKDLKWLSTGVKILSSNNISPSILTDLDIINNMTNTIDAIRGLIQYEEDIKAQDEGYKQSLNLLNKIILKCLDEKDLTINSLENMYSIKCTTKEHKVNIFFHVNKERNILLITNIEATSIIITSSNKELEFCVEDNNKQIIKAKYFNSKTKNYALITGEGKKEKIPNSFLALIKCLVEKEDINNLEKVISFLEN